MTVVVFGIDALDPELVDPEHQPSLTLNSHSEIETIVSEKGEPSTHELWPTIITGLPPEEHGLKLADGGVAWENSLLSIGSSIADYALPDRIQTALGAWILNNTNADAFRMPATYYEDAGIDTVFNGRDAKAIGVPNYVVDPEKKDREHQLRQQLGDLFERDSNAKGGHKSADPDQFYDLCMEMAAIRIARTRSALRADRYSLVFGYTSALDLIGHISYDQPEMQHYAMDELNALVSELSTDLSEEDELLLLSDHGLQNGVHTDTAFVSSTDPDLTERIDSVLDVRKAVEAELETTDHQPTRVRPWNAKTKRDGSHVKEQLKDLGYL